MMVDEPLLQRARAWLAHDPDPETRAELQALILSRSAELADRFAGPLVFGTAGLRGILGAGESRMNRAVVRRTSAGLAAHLLAQEPGAAQAGVVVGYDGRRLGREFAEDTAGTLCAAGLKVFLSHDVCPTPLVAFAVSELGAGAGVMVTASHNPPEYNGYKIYSHNGAQIIAPADAQIAAAIESGKPADEILFADLKAAQANGSCEAIGEAMRRRYLARLAELYDHGTGDRRLPIVYTPLHGVGAELFTRAMAEAGFTNLEIVAEQASPDGAFPTVAFPNPEEKGALDLAIALAREKHAALIIANDPDADRLAAVVRDEGGGYVPLGGNELGILLGHYALERDQRLGLPGTALVIASVVSSPMLGVIARARGAAYDETLTGFKWIANKAMLREKKEGVRFVFGYEEALGYSVGTVVRDKDGIGAGVVLATLAAELYARGETLLDELARIAVRYGSFKSCSRSLHFPGAEGARAMQVIMAKLRGDPPRCLGGKAVEAVIDCARGVRRARGEEQAIDLPNSNVLLFELESGHRVIARPSGTEPKLKLYFDVRIPPGEIRDAANTEATALLAALQADMLARAAR